MVATLALLGACIWVSGDELEQKRASLRDSAAVDSQPAADDTGPADGDGDGVPADEDCDDGDASVYPGAPEALGDAIDADCGGDGDGFSLQAMSLPALSGLRGPRLVWASGRLHLGLAAESAHGGALVGALYAGGLDTPSSPPETLQLLGDPDGADAWDAAFDFAADGERLAWATATLGGARRLLIDAAASDGYGYVALEGDPSGDGFSRLQLDLSADTLRAVACEPEGVWALEVDLQSMLDPGAAELAALRSDLSPYSACEISGDAWLLGHTSGPLLEYSFDAQGSAPTLTPADERGTRSVLDIESVSTRGWTQLAISDAGPGLYLESALGALESATSEPLVEIDVTSGDAGVAYLCGVGSSGAAWLYYGDPAQGLTEVPLPLDAVDDCAIAVADYNEVAALFRRGDTIWRGVVLGL